MEVDALLLVDKPKGWTSHDVVAFVRRLTGWKKVGHFGSLDPLATGLLLLGIGRATRLFPYLSRQPKVYEGAIRFGQATDTYDAEGQPLSPPSSNLPTEKELKEMIKSFEGEIEQVPPPFSAKKYKGKPLYKLARKGQSVPLKPIKVKIYEFKIIEYNPPNLIFKITCSSGTYIRSIAHDLGQKAGCGAYLAELVRLAIGPFCLEKAFSLVQIEEAYKKNQLELILLPLEKILDNLPKAILSERIPWPLVKGKTIPPQAIKTLIPPVEKSSTQEEENIIRLFSYEGRFLGLARPASRPGYILPFLLI